MIRNRKIAPVLSAIAILIFFGLSWVLPQARLSPEATPKVDKVIVLKRDHLLELLHGGMILKTYKVSLGSDPKGPKTQQGDGKTPEGSYVLDFRNEQSQFHRSIHISYPNPADRERARKLGVSPGGDIFVHGLPNGWGWLGRSHLLTDWTDGCIAVTNPEIEEIWRLVSNGTPIEIKP